MNAGFPILNQNWYILIQENTFKNIVCDIQTFCLGLSVLTHWGQGAVSIRKTVLPGMAIPMLKIRRPNGRLIFNMEIAIRR